ncbi:MAG: response regulator, partial [Cyanothece sp. SIO1E1]|nr:response regulator [Cyanothece sp. SIO1E1]
SFDLVLCDYRLPSFDGVSALKAVREKQGKIPVIMISGVLGEDAAVECLQLGANDYVLKQRLERLPNSIQRVLREVDERKKRWEAEQSLKESESRFRRLAESSSDGFWFEDILPKRVVVYASPSVEKMWGIDCNQLKENPKMRILGIHTEDRALFEESWEDCIQKKTPNFEVE